MTQSGQGEEPSARPAREGIVLPSDGGEPLLPGGSAGPVAPGGVGGQPPASAPSGGQTWGTPWGPEEQLPAPSQGQGWQSPPAQQWGPQEPAPWGAQDPAASGHGQGQHGPGPLPPEGGQAPAYGAHTSYDPSVPIPPQNGSFYGVPAVDAYGSAAAGALPDGSEGATQFLPPVPAAPVDEGATQYIPPVGPGALPPEMPAAHDSEATRYPGPPAGNPDAEATQFMAPVTDQPGGAPYGAAPGAPADDGNRQPPAEFDNLFRGAGADTGAVGSTQQLPRFEHPQPAHTPPGRGGGGRRAAREGDGGGRSGRTGSRVPLIAAVGVGLVVLGIGAGAMLGSGDDSGKKQPVSAAAPTSEEPEAEASPTVDPVRQQAVELDKLLAVSGDSRTAVINAVADVKACRNLDQAAKDLRDAADQRNQLVTDLSGIEVDKLPDHQALSTALTKAWQASASADDHYAAWADQVAGKKGCKKGQARTTGQTEAGNRASGTATEEKTKAASLWNAIAKQYGLTERQPTQL
ncbi:hypothetical protein DIZ27_28590 [Streptomyces sp. NWU339]|uniref:hypothetical protein n=1 Tax=Streptomyces sp. NWU339 TaxID=2185284 RepID=UPI000D676BB0|nr:hypothetical protein [Streptomyces sp. NWU339]PWI07225.1 hypothetical protein DIZ27_28590 [Streptomyces sp. NWU339]